MGRRKVEKNHTRRERLIQFMNREKLSQNELSRRTGIKQQRICEMVKDSDDFQNLTDVMAEEIIKAFPEYRIQWLLGYDDFMTHDMFDAYVLDAARAADPDNMASLSTIMRLLVNARGFSVSTDRMRAINAHKTASSKAVVDGCEITHDGKTISIPTYAWDEIVNEVCDFAVFKLQREIDKANPARKG